MTTNAAPVLKSDEYSDVLGMAVMLGDVRIGRVKKHTRHARTWCTTSVHNDIFGRRISSSTHRTRQDALEFLVKIHALNVEHPLASA